MLFYQLLLDVLLAPLGEFFSLKISKVIASDDNTTPTPFILRRLIGRVYHIGLDGASIGISPHCSISLPAETEIQSKHCQIVYDSSIGHYMLNDLTNGSGAFYYYNDQSDIQRSFPLTLTHGVRFVTGNILWELTSLPPLTALTAKLFHFAKERNLSRLKRIIEDLEMSSNSVKVPVLTVTGQ